MVLLSDFPAEVLNCISSYCSSADVVNLAIACPRIADAVLPSIYRYIVVDPVPHALSHGRPHRLAHVSVGQQFVPVTTVHTIAGTKQLLDTLARNPELAKHVRSFSVRGNIALNDIALITRVRSALKNLGQLTEFEWTACPELPPSILDDLPHEANGENTELLALTIDLATRPGDLYPRVFLPNLRKLRVRPFLNSELLQWMKKVVSRSFDLEDIQLGRYLDTKSEVGSSFTFVGRSDIHQQPALVPAVSVFFGGAIKRQLRSLRLDMVDTCPEDCAVLTECVDLSQLRELQLVGSGREDEQAHGVLRHISLAAPQLAKVEISWSASQGALAQFLRSCCANARALKLTIHKQPRATLAVLADVCRHLRYLDIEIFCDFHISDLMELEQLTQLEVLKVPFNHSVHSWNISAHMTDLKVLELRTQLATQPMSSHRGQRPANMGLLTGGILDEFDNQFCSPLQNVNLKTAALVNPSLEYLIVDGRVTQLDRFAASAETYAW